MHNRMYQIHHQEEAAKYEKENPGVKYPIKLYSRSTMIKLANTVPLGKLKSLRGKKFAKCNLSISVTSWKLEVHSLTNQEAVCKVEMVGGRVGWVGTVIVRQAKKLEDLAVQEF